MSVGVAISKEELGGTFSEGVELFQTQVELFQLRLFMGLHYYLPMVGVSLLKWNFFKVYF